MRAVLIAALASISALAASPAQAQVRKQGSDPLVYVNAGDAAMNGAIAKARQTLPDFFARFARPQPGEVHFLLKFDLLPEPDKAEFIWAEIVSRSPGFTLVRLANAPADPRWKLGQQVSVRDSDVIDWGYYKDGVMQGQYTTRILLPTLGPADSEAIRKAYRW
jgi:uncharacterized protein YegJ (DUF2314 family)